MDAADVEDARCTWELRNTTGGVTDGIRVAAAFQATNDPATPGSTHYLENEAGDAHWRTTTAVHYAEAFKDISANTQDKQVIRLGWAAKNGVSGGSTLNVARVSGVVFLRKA